MNEALNEAVHERFRFIEEILYWLQFIRFFRGPFNVQMLHIPALLEREKEEFSSAPQNYIHSYHVLGHVRRVVL
jgi:hypothetical protein